MYMRQFTVFLSFLFFCTQAFTQIESGVYQAFKVDKNASTPDIIYCNVIDLGNDMKIFNDGDKKPLDGEYHIIISKTRYVIGNFKKGYANGDWTQYWNNEVEEKGAFKNGKYDGLYVEQKTGERYEYTFKEGVMQRFISKYSNGQVGQERNYDENGKIQGEVIVYDENGNIKRKNNYLHGELDGPQMKKEGGYTETYSMKNNRKVGDYCMLYSNGNIQKKGMYNEDGKETGKWYFGNEAGDPQSEVNYLDGKKNGEEKMFFDGGKLRFYTEYTNDVRNGKRIEYNREPYGISLETNYKNGSQDGECKMYYNGVLDKELTYKDGEVISAKRYENGKLVQMQRLDADGTLTDVPIPPAAKEAAAKTPTTKTSVPKKLKQDASGIIDVQ